jgi:hypothetical protein
LLTAPALHRANGCVDAVRGRLFSHLSYTALAPTVHPTGHYWQRDGPRPSQARTDGIDPPFSQDLSPPANETHSSCQLLTPPVLLVGVRRFIHHFPPAFFIRSVARPRRTVLGRLFSRVVARTTHVTAARAKRKRRSPTLKFAVDTDVAGHTFARELTRFIAALPTKKLEELDKPCGGQALPSPVPSPRVFCVASRAFLKTRPAAASQTQHRRGPRVLTPICYALLARCRGGAQTLPTPASNASAVTVPRRYPPAWPVGISFPNLSIQPDFTC